MKVLIAANIDLGLFKFRKELIQKLIEMGNEVFISLPDGDLIPALEYIGCKFIETDVDRRGMNPITDLELIKNYKKILKEINPDLVITYTIKPNLYMGMLCRKKKIPYVINITGLGTAFQSKGAMLKAFIGMYKIACKKAKTVIFENCDNMQTFLDYGIVKKEQCLLNNGAGVNLDEYQFTPYPDDKEIRFLFIGRVMQEKGIDELFEVAKRIKKEFDNVYFDIVGPYEDDYKEITEKLVADGVINYYGYQDDVKPFIEKSHCFVLPSWHEGMANTNLESAAMGRPIITSNIHGCLEAVVENVSGFLCEPRNVDSLFNQVIKFIKRPYESKVEMGKQGRKHMEENFDKRLIIKNTANRIFN